MGEGGKAVKVGKIGEEDRKADHAGERRGSQRERARRQG